MGIMMLVLLAGACAAVWVHEFVHLMGLRDDELPGRFDKLVWVFVLVATGPVGAWAFRSYRTGCWPAPLTEAEAARRRAAKPAPGPEMF
jgi:hypothetical protein